jgi:hypothetical protein
MRRLTGLSKLGSAHSRRGEKRRLGHGEEAEQPKKKRGRPGLRAEFGKR